MQQNEVIVRSSHGLHARAAARLTILASRFKSRVVLVANGRRADARSVLAVMILAAGMGSRIYIETTGPDEIEAMNAVVRLIDGGFSARG